jgi:Tfp pilus assembly PilM family ATPase
VGVETWSPAERIAVDYADVNRELVQARALQLSVALGLALRREREERA